MKLKNKKGFTLIELLAVIVVLAIIALIATPIVMNTIKKSQKGAAERSADNYIKQVETAVAEAKLENKSVPNGTYDIDGNGNLTGAGLPDGKLEINMSGNKPTSGIIKIENGGVSSTDTTMTVGDYDVKYNQENKKYEAIEKGSSTTTALCTANTSKVSALVYNSGNPGQESSYTSQEVGLLASESGAYTTGVTYTCELGDNESKTFFVLETNGDNVSLIAGFNLGSTVAWSSDGSNHKDEDASAQAVTAKAALKERTSGWTKLTESQIALPTYDQIYKAAGNKTSGFPTWLYSYTKTPIAFGYWTSTIDTSSTTLAWYVAYVGAFDEDMDVGYDSFYGVRPVITISKSQLN